MLKLDNLPKRNSLKKKKRLGRGHGSGLVKTAGKGQKGQKSRSGGSIHPKFQGGGISMYRRIPKLGGFKALNKTVYTPINMAALNASFEDGAEVTIETLRAAGLVKNSEKHVKILGSGELTRKLTVKVQAWSKTAEAKIAAAGGRIEIA